MTKDTKIKLEILAAMLLYIGIVFLAPCYKSLLPESKPIRLIFGNMVIYALMALFTLLRCGKLSTNVWQFLGYRRENLGKQLLWGLVAGIISLTVLVVLPVVISGNPGFLGSKPESLNMVPLQVIFFMLFVGPVEELMFRGYLFRLTEKLTKKPWAVCGITALLFGLWHFPVGFSLIQVGITAAIGFIYGAFYVKVKNCSLLSLSIAHGLHDTGIMMLSLLLL